MSDELLVEPGVATPRHGTAFALECAGVSARHGDFVALRDVSLRVRPGDVTAVVGPNGSGKTTLLDCVDGLHPCTGVVRLDGWDVTRLPTHRRVALGLARTFQTPVLASGLDVLRNIAVGAHHWDDGDTRAGTAAARALAARLGILGLCDRPVTTLTHSERRLVEIARALLTRPRVLMLDEPAAGFSHAEGLALCRRILDVAATLGCAVLLVEHDVPLVMTLASEVVVLHDGQVLASGRPDQVRRDPAVVAAYLGTGARGTPAEYTDDAVGG